MLDNTDRNRTSPFAFTGNRFEFRAVGSSANCAAAMIAINAAVADQLNSYADAVAARISAGEEKEQAIYAETRKLIIESKDVHFDGNGYSDEWKIEAHKRGLNTETSVPLMYDAYLSPSSVEMFRRTNVFSEIELEARGKPRRG